MRRVRRVAIGLFVMGVAAFANATAVAQTSDGAVTDPSGDCLSSPCADLTSASLTLHADGLVFRVVAARQWLAQPPPFAPMPAISIWTTSPDTGPPDAVIRDAEARIANPSQTYGFQVNYDDPFLPSDFFGAPTTTFDISVRGPEVPSFLALVGSRFRWRASLPADENRKWDEQRPVDPHPADAAPDSGSIAFSAADLDGDGLPDISDGCPDRAYSAAAPGWSLEQPTDGCPATAAPFSHHAFVAAARRAAKAFRAAWRTPSRRSLALRRHRIKLPLRLPTGVGRVYASVDPAVHTGPSRSSVYGGRNCRKPRCIVRLTVSREGVRAYARKRLRLWIRLTVGTGDQRLTTSYSTLLRMPLPRSHVTPEEDRRGGARG
jgi:hypothetical protein